MGLTMGLTGTAYPGPSDDTGAEGDPRNPFLVDAPAPIATGDEAHGRPSVGGPGSSLAAALTRAADEAAGTPTDEPAATELVGSTGGLDRTTVSGTDSEPIVAPPVAAELASQLGRFGQLHLGYDYREDAAVRLAPLERLVAPELYLDLAAPLPPALVASLAEERRVVTVEPLEVAGLDAGPDGGGVFEILLAVTERRTLGGEVEVSERVEAVVVVVDAAGLVVDVR